LNLPDPWIATILMKKNSSAYYIAKQAAQPPSYFGIHKDAIRAWELLRNAQDENPEYPCKDDPYFYTDYDGLGFRKCMVKVILSL